MKRKICTGILLALALTVAISPSVNAVNLVVKVNETLRLAVDFNVPSYGAWYFDQELAKNNSRNIVTLCVDINNTFCSDSGITWENQTISTIPECNNATWCFNPEIAFAGKNPAEHNEFQYTPNASSIGYHSLVFRGVPLMGVPYETIHNFGDIFVGTLFVADSDIIKATTESTLTEPMVSFNLTTFVSNVSGIYVQNAGENGQLEFMVSPNFFILTNTTAGVSANRTAKKTLLSNGTNYVTSYSTLNKNGTFLISLNSPYAEKLNGQRINVSAIAAEVRVFPRYDIDGSGRVDIKDSTILKSHMNESTSALPPNERPRYDIDKSGLVNNADVAILRAHYGEIIPTV